MAQGKAATEYSVTLCKKEEGVLPVMTPYRIGKKTYEKILAMIVKTQGIKEKQR